jgi:prephenate dehydrogenase
MEKKMYPEKVTFIGFGLMAGSLAKALRKINPEIKLYAVSRTMEPMQEAINDKVLDNAYNELNETVLNVDIIYLCTPIKIIFMYLDKMAGNLPEHTIVTDVGSTKSEIIDYVNSMKSPPCFVGGHPMTGAEKTGYKSATAHLYENAYYILTPSKSSTDDAIDKLENLIKKIGALPVHIDAVSHDRITAGVSHVPHIVASALVNMVKNNDTSDSKMQLMAAGGFRDITRIASSSPEMWLSVVQSNQLQISALLDGYINDLKDIKSAILADEKETIFSFFNSAREYRNALPTRKKGLIGEMFDLIIDIEDKPGIIGEITTILGNHEINIKNINLSNSRVDEPGVLKISFANMESLLLSFEILKDLGYNVSKNK